MKGPGSLALPLVLLVDDQPLIREELTAALHDGGCAVMAADDAEQAVAALESDHAHNFVGLITDVNLGGAQTGWDIARRARELCPGLPIVYVTGDSEREWATEGVPLSALLGKPFIAANVVLALATLIRKAPTSPSGSSARRR